MEGGGGRSPPHAPMPPATHFSPLGSMVGNMMCVVLNKEASNPLKNTSQSCFLGYKETIDSNQPTESKYIPEDSSQEPIFPPELILNNDLFQTKSLNFQGPDMTWYRPTEMTELLKLKKNHPGAKLVVGNTELGIEMKFKKFQYPVMIQPNYISELNEIDFNSNGVTVGK